MIYNSPMREGVCLDLYCGLGGWADGFIAAGYRTIGIDIVPQPNYPGEFILQDIRTLDGARWRGFVDVIVASPPCREFSRLDIPFNRPFTPSFPNLELVQDAYRLRDEIQPRRFVLENVRGAQKWIGKAIIHRGPYYLWGDVFMLSPMKFKHKSRLSSGARDERARIPFQLAYQVALLCKN